MASILVYGPSGHGKSSAMESLDPKSTLIICSDRKALPFAGASKRYVTVKTEAGKPDIMLSNYFETKKPSSVKAILKAVMQRPEIKTVVIDTITHIIMGEFMDRALETGFVKFNELGKDIYDILNMIQDLDSINKKDVIVIGHNEIGYDSSGNKVDKVRTVGKLIDEKIDIPSLFTTVLVPKVTRDGELSDYSFLTQSDGTNSAKSPKGMLPYKIENDYRKILDLMDEFSNKE